MSKYQGYPYVNPIVTDVPTVDPATASRWANLPRRVLSPSIPGPSGSGLGQKGYPASSSSKPTIPPKRDSIDENPVVYIDLPEADGSDVCQSIEDIRESEPEFVQDTILYDPFEDRRISPKDDAYSDQSSISDRQSAGASPTTSRPVRPDALDVMPHASSSSQCPQPSRPTRPGLPAFMEKESFIYGSHDRNGFPISPIPISQFPEPPPAYTEVAETPNLQAPVREEVTPEPVTPPRTQVIVPTPVPVSPVGVMNFNRKNLICNYCGIRVQTLVIRENGYMTHIIAFIVFLFLVPFFVVVYMTDCFKHKNHYCPNCNKIIAYELPMCSQQVYLTCD